MTILFCTSQYDPLQTGVAVADSGLCRALAENGHRVFVVTTSVFRLQTLKREGHVHPITSGNTTRDALEIMPNLHVIAFHIDLIGSWAIGEIKAYQDFVVHFECDVLVTSGIMGTWVFRWNCDLLYDLLPACRAHQKILRIHEAPEMPLSFKQMRCDWHTLKWILRNLLYGKERMLKNLLYGNNKRKNYLQWLQSKLKKCLKYYDIVFFSHTPNPSYAPYCSKIDVLPNGIFQKDIQPPKCIEAPLLKQRTENREQRTENREQRTENREQISIDSLLDMPYLLNVSNYSERSGQDLILGAYYLSWAKIPLVFVGSLDEASSLAHLKVLKQNLDAQYGFKEVLFYYGIERKQVLNLFCHAVLSLRASRHKSSPIALLESMQFATPFVCMDEGNAKDLCAELVVCNEEEMAHKIDTLLGDPDYYARISQSLHERVQNYTYEKIVAQFIKSIT